MVKTRNQNIENIKNKEDSKSNLKYISKTKSKSKTSTGVQTRSKVILKMETIELLPRIVVSKKIKNIMSARKRMILRKQATERQCDELVKPLNEHVKHNNEEMTSIWKNFEMVFLHIDKLLKFKEQVEGKTM